MARLRRDDYALPAEELAPALLGTRLVRVLEDGTRLSGWIVETEAYTGPEDRASHAFGGRRTARNESMYARPGTAYVYFTYGMHHCLNVAAWRAGHPAAVLIRAIEPVEGVEAMRTRRPKAMRDRQLCSGPGKLCQAMGVDLGLDGADLASRRSDRGVGAGSGAGAGALFIERVRGGPINDAGVVNAPRVGLGSAGEWTGALLRWYFRGNPHVSVRDRAAEGSG